MLLLESMLGRSEWARGKVVIGSRGMRSLGGLWVHKKLERERGKGKELSQRDSGSV